MTEASTGHHVDRLRLHVTAASLDTATALRAQLELLANARFPEIVARVLGRLAPADLSGTLGVIEVDLGTLAARALGDDAAPGFERALSEAVEAALAQAHTATGGALRLRTHAETAAERLEAYLVSGVAYGRPGFDPAAALRASADRPEALLAMLRRHAHERRTLDRLALQLPEEALLSLLAPADAPLILQYQQDIRRLYRRTPDPTPEPVLAHALHVLTLEYLLREAGSQFNRRAYVGHLLRGMATELGLSYPALLRLLGAALRETRRRRPISGSLPALIEALAADEEASVAAAPIAAPAPTRARGEDIAALVGRLRAATRDPAALAALVRPLSATTFAHVTHRLEPAHAALILAHLDSLAAMHRAAMLLALTDAGFAHQLRLLTLRYLLRDGGSQFNRRSWIRRLLRGLATTGGVPFGFLIESLATSLEVLRRRMPPGGSLPMAIAELVADLALEPGAQPGGDDGDRIAALAARARRYGGNPALLALVAAPLGATAFARLAEALAPTAAPILLADLSILAARHRENPIVPMVTPAWERLLRAAVIRCAIHASTGTAGAPALRADLLRSIAREARVEPGALALLLEGKAVPERNRSCASVDDAEWAAFAARLAPEDREAVEADLARIERRHAIAGFTGYDTADFRALVRACAVAVLAERPVFDRRAFRSGLRDRLVQHAGVRPAEIGRWRELAHEAAPPLADPLASVERFLRTGDPLAIGVRLPDLAESDPIGFAALLRRLTIARCGNTGELIDRLLAWMLPEEVVAALAPEAAEQAAAWAAYRAELPGGTMLSGWRLLLDALLQGRPLYRIGPVESFGAVYDRHALLRHWLARGALPWWAPRGVRAESLARHAATLSFPALRALFAGGGITDVAAGLARLLRALPETDATALLARMAAEAPAETLRSGAAASGRPATNSDEARLRTFAAALAGEPPDAGGNETPSPPAPPEPVPFETPAGGHARLLAWIAGEGPDRPKNLDRLIRMAADLADRGDPALQAALVEALRRPECRARWAAALPVELIARVVERLAPARARLLLEAHAVLAAAWRTAAPAARRGERSMLFRLLLDLIAEDPLLAPRRIVHRLMDGLAHAAPGSGGALRAEALRHARQSGHGHLAAALRPPPAPLPQHRSAGRDRPPDQADEGTPLYIANAGLVLFAPFLPHFFDRIGVLTGTPRRIVGIDAASRAVHLLQYLADARRDAPETALLLNKLLAGLPLEAPVARAIPCTDADRALCDALLTALIGHWGTIGNTSPAGLRETFLQREGRLVREPARWTLTVERRTVDVLVDQLPWGFRTLCHDWMPEPLHVEW